MTELFMDKAIARFNTMCECENDPASMDYPDGLEGFLLDVDAYWEDLDTFLEHAINEAEEKKNELLLPP